MDDRDHLTYMTESIKLIEDCLERSQDPLSQQRFFNDQLTQDAVIWRLGKLMGTASHLSNDLKHRYLQISWSTISDVRDIITHGYIDLRPDGVWTTIQDDLPQLKTMAERELQQLRGEDDQ